MFALQQSRSCYGKKWTVALYLWPRDIFSLSNWIYIFCEYQAASREHCFQCELYIMTLTFHSHYINTIIMEMEIKYNQI